jgi:hypothetical protein
MTAITSRVFLTLIAVERILKAGIGLRGTVASGGMAGDRRWRSKWRWADREALPDRKEDVVRRTPLVRIIGCTLAVTGLSVAASAPASPLPSPTLSAEWVSYRAVDPTAGGTALGVDGERLLFSYGVDRPSRTKLNVESVSTGEQPSSGLPGEVLWSAPREDGNVSSVLGVARDGTDAAVALRSTKGTVSLSWPLVGNSGIRLVGYSALTGAERWSRFAIASSNICGNAVTNVGPHLLVAGAFSGAPDFGQGPIIASSTNPDACNMFLASYDMASGALEWLIPNARTNSAPTSITADETGITVIGSGIAPSGYGAPNFVDHYSTTGQLLWTSSFGTSGSAGTYEFAGALQGSVTTPTAIVFGVGSSEPFTFDGSIVPPGSSLVALEKTSGRLAWVRQLGVGQTHLPYVVLRTTTEGTLILATFLSNGLGLEPGKIADAPIGESAVAEFAEFGSGPILWSRLLPSQTAPYPPYPGLNQIGDIQTVGDYVYMSGTAYYPFLDLPAPVIIGLRIPGQPVNFVGKLNRKQPDQTPPSVSAQLLPPPNAAGWNNTAVSVFWNSVDASPSSGIATQPPATTVTSEGGGQVVTSAASCDPAGNCATGSVTVSIDLTPPVIVAGAVTSPNANGWYRTPVTVRFNCSDALSGVASCPTDAALTTNGVGQSATGSARDRAGNTARATVAGIKIDTIAPTVTITGVTSGATYNLGAVPAAACSTVDQLVGAGVATVASASTTRAAAGVFATTCTGGTDDAGNTASPVSLTYTVTIGTGGGAAGLKALVSSYVTGSGVSSANGIIFSLNAQIDSGNWCQFIKKINDAFAKAALTSSQRDDLIYWATTRTTTC